MSKMSITQYFFPGQVKIMEQLGNGREMVSPYWFMEEMERRKLRIGGKDGKPK